MAKYTVRLKATIYYDVDIEAPDQESADHRGTKQLSELLDSVELPEPLQIDFIEVWEIEEKP